MQVQGRKWIVASALAVFAASSAQASFIFGFEGVTFNDPGDTLIGETQFQLEVSDVGGGLADFTIRNFGPEASSIANVYFDGDAATEIVEIFNTDSLVLFELGGSPGDMPGGEMIGFDADFLASAMEPMPTNGINPEEELGLRVAYTGSFDDLIDAIGMDDLRVGLHAIAFDSGRSESFVTPTPGVLALFGLAAIGGRRRRRG